MLFFSCPLRLRYTAIKHTPKKSRKAGREGVGAVGLCQPDRRKISDFWTTHLEGIAHSFFDHEHWPINRYPKSKIHSGLFSDFL